MCVYETNGFLLLANLQRGRAPAKVRAARRQDKAFAPLMPRIIIETSGELLLKVLQTGTVSTNVFLRRLHNFCVDLNWLPWPLIPKRQWPAVRFKDKCGGEHSKAEWPGIPVRGQNRDWWRYEVSNSPQPIRVITTIRLIHLGGVFSFSASGN
jgi:hypothetical protein